MKKIFFFLLISQITFCQEKNSKSDLILVGNKNMFELSPFKDLELKNKKTKYTIELSPSTIGLGKYSDISTEKRFIRKINSALEFMLEESSNVLYYFPVSNNLDRDKLRNKVIPKINGKQRVKLWVSLYNFNSSPYIVIDRIKLKK